MSAVCARQGCGSAFDPVSSNAEASCSYHPGAPDFHEGLKGWSCCKDLNKPVMEFDQFMKIPGCTKSTHLAKEDKPKAAPKPAAPAPAASAPSSVSKSGVETYGAPAPAAAPSAPTSTPSANTAVASSSAPPPPPAFVEEIDDPAATPAPGAACKRTSCKYQLGAEAPAPACTYHPGAPIFREGSKGYTCCKRRVLDFDDFLRMEGCREAASGHLFVGQKKESSEKEVVSARIDHYQTPALIHMSVFAKKVDAATSSITFTRENIVLDLNLPTSKVQRTVELYAPIDPAQSSFRILGTKVDLTLVKENGGSWPVLERLADGVELPKGYALTFGAGKH